MKKINSLEYNTLLWFLTRATFIEITAEILLNTAHQDSWISIILAIILGLIPFSLFSYLKNKYPDQNIIQINKTKLGKFGTFLNLILIAGTLIFAICSFWIIVNFIDSQYLYKTPVIIIIIVLILPVIYTIIKDFHVFSKVSLIMFFTSLFFIIVILSGLIGNIDFDNLKPILNNSPNNILYGTFCFIGFNILPVFLLNIIPKKRYEYMTKYLPSVAKKPLVMMRETAGIQASFDYFDENDAMQKFAFALKLSPFVSAIYANSPIRNSRLTKYKSNRAASWLETDNDRCGLVSPKVFSGDFSFEEYAQILLDVPMIFIERYINGVKKSLRVENLTFRKFMKQGYQGFYPNKDDWSTHLSLYFPDVRIKSYIEIRNHDNQRRDLICSVPALWKGLLYNNEAMRAVLDILKNLTYFDFEYVRRKTPKYGLDMKIKHLPLKDIAKEIVDISYQSLKSYSKGEENFLEPLKEYTDNGITPADVVIKNFNTTWNRNISKFIEYCQLK